MSDVLLIGSGAIGSVVLKSLANESGIRIRWVLDMPARRESLQRELGAGGKAQKSQQER